LVPLARFLVPETKMADDADETDSVCAMAVIVVKQRANRKEKKMAVWIQPQKCSSTLNWTQTQLFTFAYRPYARRKANVHNML